MGITEGDKSDNIRLLTVSKEVTTETFQPAVPADAEWGIDTVNLSFMVNPDLCESDTSLWSSESSRFWSDSQRTNSQVEWNFEAEFATVKVILYIAQERCTIRFNAARLLTPKSRQLLPPNALKHLVEKLLDDIRSHVWPVFDRIENDGTIVRDADWMKSVSITRLDVARNFLIDDVESLKKALVLAKPKYGKTSHLYWNSKGGWTLTNETNRSGKDRIYDKSQELASKELDESFSLNGSWFRFEAQLQKERLRKFGLQHLDGVSDESVWDAIFCRWVACKWDVTLPNRGALKAVLESIDSQNERSGVLVALSANVNGLTELFSQTKIATYSKMAMRLGLNVGSQFDELGKATRKLGLLAGRIEDI